MVPMSIRVAGPGVAPHALPLEAPQGKDLVLKLGGFERVVGIVRNASGVPLGDVPVELWVQGSGRLPSGVGIARGNRRITSDEIVRFDPRPLKTGPQGAFQTPPTLLSGSTYRVSIRRDGFVPFVSEWVALKGNAPQSVRVTLAVKLAAKDAARSEAMVEAIPAPLARARALASVAGALPGSERGRKRAILERATTLLRDHPQQANPTIRDRVSSRIAEQWLDMRELDRARLMLQGWKISSDVLQTGFLGQMARLEREHALAQLQKLPNRNNTPSYRDDELGEVAVELAIAHPVEAERIFNLRERTDAQDVSISHALRLCHRLARVDPPRVRRIAASLSGPGARACAWAFVALGQAKKDNAGASEAIDRAIQEIDRLRESGPGPEQIYIAGGIRLMYPTNPAAVILPVVERIAPERLGEVFWRAVALHPRLETDREDLLQSSYIGFECMLLSHYDREVATALFEPMDSYLRSLAARKGPRNEFTTSLIVAKACLDPRAAVAFLESLTPPRDFSLSNPAHEARLRLAEVLGLPPENRWRRLWRSLGAQVPLED